MSRISPGVSVAVQSYAEALLRVAKTQNKLTLFKDEAVDLGRALEENPRFCLFLESPQVPSEDKRALAEKIFKDKVSEVFVTLIKMLIDRGREFLLLDILAEFIEAAERSQGIYPARVTTARNLADEEKDNFQTRLEKFTASKLRIDYVVRPDLLGGFVFKYQDKLLDRSVRHGLRELRDRFFAAKLPEA